MPFPFLALATAANGLDEKLSAFSGQLSAKRLIDAPAAGS
jgi:hypothetical protein